LPTKPPLSKGERDLLTENNFNIAIVFQHNSSRPDTFTSARGEQDANRVLKLANKIGQPDHSAIYFGVDYDVDEGHIESVRQYFTAAKKGLLANLELAFMEMDWCVRS
jgi:hypothetical protein